MRSNDARALAAEIGRFVKANLSSGIASGLEYVLVTALVWGGVHYLGAATAGAIAGALTDFSLKRHWAFSRQAKAAFHHEGLRYLLVSVASLALNLAVAYLLVDGLHLPPVPGVIAASVVVGCVWNYPLHRYYVFRHPAPGPAVIAPALGLDEPAAVPVAVGLPDAERGGAGGRQA